MVSSEVRKRKKLLTSCDMEILKVFLPTEILHQIFASYLSAKDMCIFDTAICNKAKRPAFLMIIQSKRLDSLRLVWNRKKILTWLNLKGLKISHLSCNGFSEEEAKIIARFGTSLESLHLRVPSFKDSKSISQQSFLQVVGSCIGLTSLNLERFRLSNAAVLAIAECCSAIKILKFCTNTDIKDASMLKLAESCPELKSLTILQPLSTDPCRKPSSFLDPTLILRLVNTYARLTSLNLSDNKLTDAIVRTITQSCTGLLLFNISHNSGITDVSLFSVAENCKQLQTLDISCNKKFTDASLFFLAEGCVQLRSLDISECSSLSSECILRVGGLLKSLQDFKYDFIYI
jgi:hypothetical protein